MKTNLSSILPKKISTIVLVLFSILFFSTDLYSQNCILDSEKRIEIQKIKDPNTFIAHIKVYRNRNRVFNATVSFISPNVIVGAGHSFRERWYSKIRKIEIFIGQRNENGINTYIAKHTFNRKDIELWVHSKFQKSGNPDYDYALVSLNKNIVDRYFKLATFNSVKSKIDSVHINGYPGDKGNIELWTKNTTKNNITEKQNVLLHNMYTFTGDSGAPIWCEVDNNLYILGIHGTGHYRNGKCNAGVKIKNEYITAFNSFISSSKIK